MLNVIDEKHGDNYTAYNADCVEVAASLPDNSIGFSVYSPPFCSLYVFSNSDRDMGNTKTNDEFITAYKFLIKDLLRVTKAGRLTAVHCNEFTNNKRPRWLYRHV